MSEIPPNATRVLKMRVRRDDIDEIDRPVTVSTAAVANNSGMPSNSKTKTVEPVRQPSGSQTQNTSKPKPVPKTQQKWATLTQQLKNCLTKYELLQKQALCAELTVTEMPNQARFERVAQQLLGQITSLRKQLAAIRREAVQKPAANPATVNGKPACALSQRTAITVAAVTANVPQKQPLTSNQKRRTVQLSVGIQTAQILKAFADAGKSPSALVERALWQDKDVRDAALLLRLKPPVR